MLLIIISIIDFLHELIKIISHTNKIPDYTLTTVSAHHICGGQKEVDPVNRNTRASSPFPTRRLTMLSSKRLV